MHSCNPVQMCDTYCDLFSEMERHSITLGPFTIWGRVRSEDPNWFLMETGSICLQQVTYPCPLCSPAPIDSLWKMSSCWTWLFQMNTTGYLTWVLTLLGGIFNVVLIYPWVYIQGIHADSIQYHSLPGANQLTGSYVYNGLFAIMEASCLP